MRILVGQEWSDGFLDGWKAPGTVRIGVRNWCVVQQLDDLYFEHEPSFRTLIDYGREVGPVEVARKVLSRLSEGARNDKVVAIGVGLLIDDNGEETDDAVAFFAPCVPWCVERVVLPRELVWAVDEVLEDDFIAYAERPTTQFEPWAGWRRESHALLENVDELREAVLDELSTISSATVLPLDPPSPVEERRGGSAPPRSAGRLNASLLGFGHYARTIVLPNIPDEFEVTTVHEIDPLMAPDDFPVVDTAGELRPDESPDVVFVAGYHASHARLAADALDRGAWVVCEKPLATTHNGLRTLMRRFGETSRYFAGFHRRYSEVNDWIFADLQPSENDPMSYHAIVHEVKLPTRHWYNWPSAGSRLLSNGCHWIDHFLFLNGFAEVEKSEVRRGPTGEISCSITLVNGAYFTLLLTDRGSDRLGVREHTEVRVTDAVAVIEDFKSYVAEGPNGLIRREKFHKLAAHRAMYRSVGERILAGTPGDRRETVERSANTVLDLEEMLGA